MQFDLVNLIAEQPMRLALLWTTWVQWPIPRVWVLPNLLTSSKFVTILYSSYQLCIRLWISSLVKSARDRHATPMFWPAILYLAVSRQLSCASWHFNALLRDINSSSSSQVCMRIKKIFLLGYYFSLDIMMVSKWNPCSIYSRNTWNKSLTDFNSTKSFKCNLQNVSIRNDSIYVYAEHRCASNAQLKKLNRILTTVAMSATVLLLKMCPVLPKACSLRNLLWPSTNDCFSSSVIGMYSASTLAQLGPYFYRKKKQWNYQNCFKNTF